MALPAANDGKAPLQQRQRLVIDPANRSRLVKPSTLRNRRRRMRRRLRARGMRAGIRPPPPLLPPEAEEKKEENHPMDILNNLSPILRTYADAVVDPLAAGAVGALKPDQWTTESLPVTDRLTIDIDPSRFFTASGPMDTIEGFFIAIVPRCFAAGWARTDDNQLPGDSMLPIINSTSDFNAVNQARPIAAQNQVPWVMANQYVMLIGTIGVRAGSQNVFGYYSVNDTMVESTTNRVNTTQPMSALNGIAFSRYANYEANADGGRILGAGLKVTAEAAPINTGGTCYGGWMTQEEMVACFTGTSGSGAKTATNLIDAMFLRTNYRGGDGITVRYHSGQSPIQMDYKKPFNGLVCNQSANYFTGVENNINLDPASQDCCDPGDYCPVVVWRYDDGQAANVYSLRVEAKIHVQAKPKGTCPFITMAPGHDVLVEEVDDLVSNVDLFPPVVTGNTFKSFLRTITSFGRRAINTVGHGVESAIPHINKFLDLANRYGPTVIQAAEAAGPLLALL